jgi:ABC-type phosphate/phosphonate transport system substrate-binding protein
LLLIASARMYVWSPSLAAAWRRLLEWLSRRAMVALDVTDQAVPTPLDELWRRDDMGCVFMCGYPWALAERRPELLAAPVPSPPRYGGRAVYFTDFVVRADSPYKTLEDTFGGSIAYSTDHSHSGYNAPRYHLLRYRTPERSRLYGRVLGPYIRQRPVLEAVINGEADVAPVDGYALELLGRHDSGLAGRIRVIESTEAAPSPPLVASAGVDRRTRERLTETLLAAHQSGEMASTLEELLLARFVSVQASEFRLFLDWKRAAEEAGYPKLA